MPCEIVVNKYKKLVICPDGKILTEFSKEGKFTVPTAPSGVNKKKWESNRTRRIERISDLFLIQRFGRILHDIFTHNRQR